MKLFKTYRRNPYSHDNIIEEKIENIKFKIHKLSNRPNPNDKNKTIIFCCFSEFGCETVGVMYTVPQIIIRNPNKYKIVIGWHGRKYLYQHLVDEFWEINEEFMSLREFARAFHHDSDNLSIIEKKMGQFGHVIKSSDLGNFSISARCKDCDNFWNTVRQSGDLFPHDFCPKCKSKNTIPPIIGSEISYWKKRAISIPIPSEEKLIKVQKFIKKPTVGVFARGRKCYGRNLQPEFYIKLIKLLRDLNYDVIWLGEKVSTQKCPVDDVVDFSRMEDSKDLEITFSIIKSCEFTIQFWTASTRLSGMMGVPYILFESPDQIWGKRGQEGIRRNLCDLGKRKLSVNHFLNIYDNNDEGINVVRRCIEEIKMNNFSDMIGMVENKDLVLQTKKNNDKRIGAL
jgi:hypothetical protein